MDWTGLCFERKFSTKTAATLIQAVAAAAAAAASAHIGLPDSSTTPKK